MSKETFYPGASGGRLAAFPPKERWDDWAELDPAAEGFVGDLLSSKDFTFASAGMLRGTILVGLVLVAIQVVATVLACAFYNLFAELFGGIEVTVIQEDAPAGKR